MKGGLISISLVFIFLVLVSTVASAAQYTKIGNGTEPAIDGSKITWTDNGIIHIYDLTLKKDVQLSSSSAFHPAISGNKLVWYDESTKMPRFTVYDLKTRARSHISKNVDNTSIPAIYGNRVVWSANTTVYMWETFSRTQTQIAIGDNPDIYRNKIVYDSYTEDDTPQIFIYDIGTKKSIDISEYGDNMFAHIYGNKVIWSDFYNRLGNIRMYDIATKQQTEVTTGDDMTGYDTGGPTDIYGNKIVYLKHNNLSSIDFGDVYLYNINTGKSKQVSFGNTSQTPVISGNLVVWSDSGNIYVKAC